MLQENVELARRGYEAFNRGDIDGLLDLCGPDIEWRDFATIDSNTVTGKGAVRAYFETVMEAWERIRLEPEEFIDLGGGRVVVVSHLTGRGKGSGVVVETQGADLLTFDEGSLVRWMGYADRAQALEAAGLSE
jgi:ketosteroid isomerase-like protein